MGGLALLLANSTQADAFRCTDELVSEGRSALKRAKVTYHSRFEGWMAAVDDHLAFLWRSAWGVACERQQQSNADDPLYHDLLRILRHVQVGRL
jgi:hypothetical protein